ncbi:hypothetical protein [uncultured Enterococcus sp.]|uniref:hypothetical protein n=1 Tax=uncultured Enterococcus sp. TaxID=167972 RepID=UPI002592ED75|nr:hypothetical protein [uncultured Enterococcus sp.]
MDNVLAIGDSLEVKAALSWLMMLPTFETMLFVLLVIFFATLAIDAFVTLKTSAIAFL